MSDASSPSVCVLVPVRNGAAHVGHAIESVLAQRCPGLKLVVSDNFSTDGTAALLERFAVDARVELVRPEAPLGMVAHFNRCLARVEAPYFMLLCHDDYLVRPDALARAREALDANPDVAAAYSDLAYVDEAGAPLTLRRFARPAGRVDGDRLARAALRSNRNLFGIPVLVRTAALGVHRYDERLPYSSDLDLSIALSRGGSIWHFDEVFVANRFHKGNASVGLFRRAASEFDLIAAKHDIRLSPFDALRRRAAILATSVQKWLFFRWLALRTRREAGRGAS